MSSIRYTTTHTCTSYMYHQMTTCICTCMCAPVTVYYMHASVDKLTTNNHCMTPAASDDARDHSRMQRLTHVLLDQSSITQQLLTNTNRHIFAQ